MIFFNFQFYGLNQLFDLHTCNHYFLPVSVVCQSRDTGLLSQSLTKLLQSTVHSKNQVLSIALSRSSLPPSPLLLSVSLSLPPPPLLPSAPVSFINLKILFLFLFFVT